MKRFKKPLPLYVRLASSILIVVLVLLLYGSIKDVFQVIYPLHGKLTDTTILSGAQRLYQESDNPLTLLPTSGNDSMIYGLYRMQSGKAQIALANPVLLKACTKNPEWCSRSPSWRPRSGFIVPSSLQFQSSDLYNQPATIKKYVAFATSSTTSCTAFNVTGNDRFYTTPNADVLCVNPTMNILSYEYISAADSVKL